MKHPTALIDASAEIDDDVEIGPYTVIGPDVHIGAGSVISSHVLINGPTRIGKNNRIFQFSSIGDDTPDLKYKGEPTRLIIGDNNTIREGVTIHRGTVQDNWETVIDCINQCAACELAQNCTQKVPGVGDRNGRLSRQDRRRVPGSFRLATLGARTDAPQCLRAEDVGSTILPGDHHLGTADDFDTLWNAHLHAHERGRYLLKR